MSSSSQTSSAKAPGIGSLLKPLERTGTSGEVAAVSSNYLSYYDKSTGKNEGEVERRKQDATAVSNAYYNLATDFFEYGWGESFHFCVRRPGESREHSMSKHEYYLALKMGLHRGQRVLDIGCGVGGPARHIASFTESSIVGINYNDYQLQRCKILTEHAGLANLCSFVKGDFHQMPFDDNSFDGAYAIEATCHSGNLVKVFNEVYRVLKPGGVFAVYDWLMTDKYDENNAQHRKIKHDIEEGDGLPDIIGIAAYHTAIRSAGLEIIECRDRVVDSVKPWYELLQPQWTLSDFRSTPTGRWLTHLMLNVLETVHLAPRGSVEVHRTLCKGADSLVAGGVTGIFTPMYMVVARKPKQ